MCLDVCQLDQADIHTQSVYLIKRIRNKNLTDDLLFNCLLCGKCQEICPVDIEINSLRITQRIESTQQYNSTYNYLTQVPSPKAEIIYFAGCMTHLTPTIIKSMKIIFAQAEINYWFMDQDKAPCCGRPLMQAGQYDAARQLIDNNQQKIIDSGAKKLIVSCPICYKVFREDYALKDIEVLHHSEFILDLIENNKIAVSKTIQKMIYHDPCELGRASGIYEKPRAVLKNYGELIEIKEQKQDALCCGGSLSNIKIQMSDRDKIKNNALDIYMRYKPDVIVTACPLCKKTFNRANSLNIKDISEIVANNITKSNNPIVSILEKNNEILVQNKIE